VLAKLGADVLAVNPYAATAGAASFDRKAQARQVAELVRTSRATMGAVIDPDGERITLIDDTGRVLDDDQVLFVLLALVAWNARGDERVRVAVPVATSSHIEAFARENGADLVWTKMSTPAVMDVANRENVTFAAGGDGGYIWPSFVPAYDAAATFVNVLALLARRGVRLSKLVDDAPRIHMARDVVPTPWEQKGMVMRNLMDLAKDERTILVDGVKVIDDTGWVLLLPDPEQPTTHVLAEGVDDADAKAKAGEWVRRVRNLLRP